LEHRAQHNAHSRLQGATLQDGTLVTGDALLCAAGAWTANIMCFIKGHSLILPTSCVLTQTIFFERLSHGSPEVYVRSSQTAFFSGYPGDPIRVQEVAGSGIHRTRNGRSITISAVCANMYGLFQ